MTSKGAGPGAPAASKTDRPKLKYSSFLSIDSRLDIFHKKDKSISGASSQVTPSSRLRSSVRSLSLATGISRLRPGKPSAQKAQDVTDDQEPSIPHSPTRDHTENIPLAHLTLNLAANGSIAEHSGATSYADEDGVKLAHTIAITTSSLDVTARNHTPSPQITSDPITHSCLLHLWQDSAKVVKCLRRERESIASTVDKLLMYDIDVSSGAATITSDKGNNHSDKKNVQTPVKSPLKDIQANGQGAWAKGEDDFSRALRCVSDEQQSSEKDGLFWRFHPDFVVRPSELSVAERVHVPYSTWTRRPALQLVVKPHSLCLNGPSFEPFYGTLYLLDLKRQKRLSENFYFDLNDRSLLQATLGSKNSVREDACEQAIFSISEPSESVVMVLRVERVLQGDPVNLDLYTKLKPRTNSELNALITRSGQAIGSLAEFRQPFAIGVVPLFDNEGQLRREGRQKVEQLSFQLESLGLDELVRTCEDILEEPSKRRICPNSSFWFSLSPVMEDTLPSRRFDPSGHPLSGASASGSPNSYAGFSQSCLEFQFHTTHPATTFCNLLYIYPDTFTFQKYRNLAVKVEVLGSTASNQPCMSGARTRAKRVSHYTTQVNYHKKMPSLEDEIKIFLPISVSAESHILFTFQNVSVRTGKHENIGYASLPLLNEGSVVGDGQHSLGIFSKLPGGYLELFRDNAAAAIGTFSVRVQLVSSVFNQDRHLTNFFRALPNEKELEGAGKKHGIVLLRNTINNIPLSSQDACIRFLPALLNRILHLICTRKLARYMIFLGLVMYVDRVAERLKEKRAVMLQTYVVYKFENVDGSPLFEYLPALWISALSRQEDPNTNFTRQMTIKHGWFFLELIYKSLCLFRAEKGGLPSDCIARFVENFKNLLRVIARFIYRRRSTGFSNLKSFLNNLGLFFMDLFTVLQRELVMGLLEDFILYDFADNRSDPVLVDFKFTFYSILIDHDYFLYVDDAFAPNVQLEPDMDFVETIKQRHRLCTIVCSDVVRCLQCSEEVIKEKVINTLQAILTTFDHDKFTQPFKDRVALMFFPLLYDLCHNIELAHELRPVQRRSILVCVLWVLKHVQTEYLQHWLSTIGPTTTAAFLSILNQSLCAFEYKGLLQYRSNPSQPDSILASEVASQFSQTKRQSVRELKSGIEDMMASVHKTSASARNSSRRSLRDLLKANTGHLRQLSSSVNGSSPDSGARSPSFQMACLEAALVRNVSRVVLRALCMVVQRLEKDLSPAPTSQSLEIFAKVLHIFSTFMMRPQATRLLLCIFPLLEVLIQTHGPVFMSNKNLEEQSVAFAAQLFRLCSFVDKNVRTSALNLLNLVLIINFKCRGESSLSVLQQSLTVSLSQMVEGLTPPAEAGLHASLADLRHLAVPQMQKLALAENDKITFVAKRQNLLTRLSTILADSLEILRYIQLGEQVDPTRTEHLILRVSTAFDHLPQSQISWLTRLADHHRKLSNFAETAQVFLMMARIHKSHREAGTSGAQYKSIIVDMDGIEDDEKQLINFYESACDMFTTAELWNHAAEVLKLVLPMYERKKAFDSLAAAHKQLHDIYIKLVGGAQLSPTLGNSYYRVAFYGQKFGKSLDGKEFVYKFSKMARLGEISEHMKTVYSKMIGDDVTVLPVSTVDASSLDASKSYLLITFVTPHDEHDSARDRIVRILSDNTKKGPEHCPPRTNLQCFCFSTPFTKDGRPFGQTSEQYKRTTRIFTRMHFPATTTALEVVHRSESELSPIEYATENIEERTDRLLCLITSDSVTTKELTGVLSGSVATQVHGGAKEVCEAFLRRAQSTTPTIDPDVPAEGGLESVAENDASLTAKSVVSPLPTSEQLANLRQSLRWFLTACGRALDVNRILIDSEGKMSQSQSTSEELSNQKRQQLLFQNNLESCFDDLCQAVEPYIRERVRVSLELPKVSPSSTRTPTQTDEPEVETDDEKWEVTDTSSQNSDNLETGATDEGSPVASTNETQKEQMEHSVSRPKSLILRPTSASKLSNALKKLTPRAKGYARAGSKKLPLPGRSPPPPPVSPPKADGSPER